MKYKGKISDPLDLVTKQWTESTVNTAKTEAISTASADATTKANAAQVNSNKYADTLLTQAKSYTDSQIQAAINASY